MVSPVSNSLGGSAAYSRSSQLGSSNAVQTRQKPAEEAPATDSSPAVREPEQTERTEETTNDNRKKDTTQLESRNDDTTLQTEAQRGSLLDIAV
jgi:hypothetical protein